MSESIVGIDLANGASRTTMFDDLVRWSIGDPIPRFLCRSHAEPQYEHIGLLHRYDRPNGIFFAELRYECGARLLLTKTMAEFTAMSEGWWREYNLAFSDDSPLAPEHRLVAAGRLVIGAWERSSGQQSTAPERSE